MAALLLLLLDAAPSIATPSLDLNVLWQQLIANSPLAGVLLYLLVKSNGRVEKLEDRVLTAFEANSKSMAGLAEAVRSCPLKSERSELSNPGIRSPALNHG